MDGTIDTFGEFTWGFKDVCFGVTVELAGGDAFGRRRLLYRRCSMHKLRRLCIEHKNSLKSITPDASKSASEHGGNLLLCVRCAHDGTEFVHHHCEFVQIKHSVGVCVKVAKQAAALSSSPGVSGGTCHGGVSGGRKRERCGV